ncbi:MAG: PilZ domain-containing protein [Sphingomicrobium sp.]
MSFVMDESNNPQNRRSRRSHVLMAASIEADGLTVPVKLRNLSTEGALVEGDALPSVDSPVVFRKNELKLSGHVAWISGRRAGIAFDAMLDPESVLRHVPSPRPRKILDFRRPRIRESQLSTGERKIAEDWIFGEPAPSIES